MSDVLKDLRHLVLGTRLKRVGLALQETTRQWLVAQGCEIPAAQLPVIAILDRQGSATVGELARELGVAQPGVSRMLEQLDAGGWVDSKRELEDRRVRRIVLTEQGSAFADAARQTMWPIVEAGVERLCEGLSGSFIEQLTALEDAIAGSTPDRLFDEAAPKPSENRS